MCHSGNQQTCEGNAHTDIELRAAWPTCTDWHAKGRASGRWRAENQTHLTFWQIWGQMVAVACCFDTLCQTSSQRHVGPLAVTQTTVLRGKQEYEDYEEVLQDPRWTFGRVRMRHSPKNDRAVSDFLITLRCGPTRLSSCLRKWGLSYSPEESDSSAVASTKRQNCDRLMMTSIFREGEQLQRDEAAFPQRQTAEFFHAILSSRSLTARDVNPMFNKRLSANTFAKTLYSVMITRQCAAAITVSQRRATSARAWSHLIDVILINSPFSAS